ncbi:MAG: LysR substrate-binding domain-containing protein, partial [Myxococcales bacterium]
SAELAGHDCLRFLTPAGQPRDWSFRGPSTRRRGSAATDRLLVDNGEVLVAAARAGMGITQVFDFMVGEALREGSLVELLPSYAAPGPPIRAVWLPRRRVSVRVRELLRRVEDAFTPPARTARTAER